MSETKSLGDYFFKGEKQNGSLRRNYRKVCVIHHLQTAGAPESAITTRGPAFAAGTNTSHSQMMQLADRNSLSRHRVHPFEEGVKNCTFNRRPNPLCTHLSRSQAPLRKSAWKSLMLQQLFGGAEKPRTRKPSAQAMTEEEELMQELAEAEEDDIPDDSGIELRNRLRRGVL
ncbi:hypothetical protein B0H13DRAFT_1850795 [Mycena leptocephala]|nr:hypothetical protein B0H13DRAFT_1850795 [Mycena leptocephala]